MIKIASKFKFPPCFSYYLILLKDMRLGKEPSYNLIHSAGGLTAERLIVLLFSVLTFSIIRYL